MDPVVLRDAFTDINGLAARLRWEPFRPGVEISRIYTSGSEGPSAAFLRYAPGAEVPYHTHRGYEHICILKGSQVDRSGRHGAGAFIVNPPGSSHHVTSPDGCIVLVIWEAPVVVEVGSRVGEGGVPGG
ncbi:MAG: cupin domain-containing protein [Phycisphaerae bacterium]